MEHAEHVLVKTNRINQYTTSTGQKTGRLNTSLQEQQNAIAIAFVAAYQNLNSGSRRTKGRNSSSFFVGSVEGAPSSISVSVSREGSNFGVRKARKRLRR
jgi:hypothetical protein